MVHSEQSSRTFYANEPVLSISGLSYCYPDRHSVLKYINLKVWSGERVGVIGPNGAGKTTFFLLSCGVLKPTAGEIRLFGKPVVPGEFRPEVGMVFQNPNDQLFCPSVKDDIAFGPRNLGQSNEEVDARVREALSVTGILKLGDRPPHHLSGGEKRLAAIAGVLAMHPRLVIYDEPTSGLDMRYRRRLIRFLQASSQEAMLIASHDLEFILEVCDRVVLMDGGYIIADGNPRDILGNVRLMEAHGLERPHSLVPHAEPHHK
ncbi:cobalt ABC transporter ATP-binding protein [Desulforamulus profundi]|uniref:Cobalt ABC transporter ATP-binding protein n=1 Tax=Desulforamulus profundi TaxID=1383067 RepID=A0A2C6MD93_9FIRM|nr:ABC transporter ATP-binding protein [Desulforamulus profundi]PHJ37562.1 cobalt ABC transporter ATP-binding protein [Desulforamulus profundi]